MNAAERADAERARLQDMVIVSEAEGTVSDARMAELKAAQDRAWRRHIAAKGLLTRARKDGSAQKIAAAAERERQAYAEFDRVSHDAIDEMLELNGARLSVLGELQDQMGRAWAADAAVLAEIMGKGAEAGQRARVHRSPGRSLGPVQVLRHTGLAGWQWDAATSAGLIPSLARRPVDRAAVIRRGIAEFGDRYRPRCGPGALVHLGVVGGSYRRPAHMFEV